MYEATDLLNIVKSTAVSSYGLSILYGTAKSETSGTSCMVQLDGSSTSQSVKTLAKPKINDRVVMILADKRLTVIGVLGGDASYTKDVTSRDNFGYVRYEDGRMEVWGNTTYTNMAINDAWGSVYCSKEVKPKMVSGFKTVSSCSVSMYSSEICAMLCGGYSGPNTDIMGSFFIVRPTPGTTSIVFHYHVIGTWK